MHSLASLAPYQSPNATTCDNRAVLARGLSFDLDDTLIDGDASAQAIIRTCEEIAPRIGLDPARVLAANEEAWHRYWPDVEDGWMLGRLDGEAVSLEAWRRTLLACGVNDVDLARAARQAHIRHAQATARLHDDASPMLDLLKPRFPLAVITNGASDTQRSSLRLLDLEDRFDAVLISGELGVAKPDPAVFRMAAARLGVEPVAVWHIGDNLGTDVAGARAAGLTAVWLNRLGAASTVEVRPDHEIRSLDELPALLGLS